MSDKIGPPSSRPQSDPLRPGNPAHQVLTGAVGRIAFGAIVADVRFRPVALEAVEPGRHRGRQSRPSNQEATQRDSVA